MTNPNLLHSIQAALRTLATSTDLRHDARAFFATLGYQSERTLSLVPNTAAGLCDTFGFTLAPHRALTDQWLSVDLLFQLTDEEMRHIGHPSLPFDSRVQVDTSRIESYLFFAIRLRNDHYPRTQLATITRELNRHFPMPVLVLLLHGHSLTLSIINRRIHRRDETRDVLEKVTLIKGVDMLHPHRAHLDILADLALPTLAATAAPLRSFVDLQRAWEAVLSSSELNQRFYREIANWYFWATQHVTFPDGGEPDPARRNDISIIRLITRLIFVWFLKEKGLVPPDLFSEQRVTDLLIDTSPDASTYYKAILQNLFFATLNQEMGQRGFRTKATHPGGRDQHRLVTTRYRYQDAFTDGGDTLLALTQHIPFLNGGLFECLDTETDDHQVVRIDGFSDGQQNPLSVPNTLFFAHEHEVDLHRCYGTSGKPHRVRGLIRILNRYAFTVTENTPIEEEIALDPELLGQVFENLLAAYNPETGATARKQTGSFYTPRAVVSYMVDESLAVSLESALHPHGTAAERETLRERVWHLLAYTDEEPRFNADERRLLIEAIDRLHILDPACGSGAFPIGVLHKLVFLLGKLDPGNAEWKQRQIANVHRDQQTAGAIADDEVREQALETLAHRLEEIDHAFAYDALDYARKLYLIQNGIYGVDIQPIAVQIAKLRCFIALIVDQQTDDRLPNRGILALPNLETRFVAANTLLGAGVSQGTLRSPIVLSLEADLAVVRQRHFEARTPRTKRRYREEDRRLRQQLGKELQRDGVPGATADMLAMWNPYDQNATAPFFDAAWMFGITEGFSVVIGNPPYVRQEQIKHLKPLFKDRYTCYTGVADLYVYFYERGLDLLQAGGVLTYISSNKYFRAGYGAKLRDYLASKTTIQHLIDFGDAPVFTAIAYPSIIIARKAAPGSSDQVRALSWEPGSDVATFANVVAEQSFLIAQKELTADGWRLELPTTLRLLDKLRQAGTPLGEYVQGRFYYGIKTGLNEAFVVDRATRDRLIAEHPSSADVLKPFLRGRDVKRWRVEPPDLWLIFTRRGIDITQYPAIHNHLLSYKDRLMPGVPGGRAQGNYEWYELQASPADTKRFEEPKIIFSRFLDKTAFAFDRDGYFPNNALWVIGNANHLLTAILNSKVGWWFLLQHSTDLQNKFLQVFKDNLLEIGIPAATPAQQAPIAALVERILAAKRANPAADVAALEAEIDAHVYRLYGLTADEVRVVGGVGQGSGLSLMSSADNDGANTERSGYQCHTIDCTGIGQCA